MAPEQKQMADMRQFWSVISRRKWVIFWLSGAASLLAAFAVFAMTPIYQASATILIESQQANVVSIEQVYGLDTRNLQYFKTQFEILKSRPLVEDVISALQLSKYREYNVAERSSSTMMNWRDWMPGSMFVGFLAGKNRNLLRPSHDLAKT